MCFSGQYNLFRVYFLLIFCIKNHAKKNFETILFVFVVYIKFDSSITSGLKSIYNVCEKYSHIAKINRTKKQLDLNKI